MFGNKITKTIFIDGMSCGHCSKRVEAALRSLKDVKSVKVNLEAKNAVVTLKSDIENKILKTVVEDIGFQVKKVE